MLNFSKSQFSCLENGNNQFLPYRVGVKIKWADEYKAFAQILPQMNMVPTGYHLLSTYFVPESTCLQFTWNKIRHQSKDIVGRSLLGRGSQEAEWERRRETGKGACFCGQLGLSSTRHPPGACGGHAQNHCPGGWGGCSIYPTSPQSSLAEVTPGALVLPHFLPALCLG